MCNFSRGHYKHLCEIILNLDQWFRRCYLKYFLSTAQSALLFDAAEPIVQFWYRLYGELAFEIILNLKQMSFRCKVYRRMKTDHNSSPKAQSDLKILAG